MKRYSSPVARVLAVAIAIGLATNGAFAVTSAKHKRKGKSTAAKSTAARIVRTKAVSPKAAALRTGSSRTTRSSRRKVWVQTWDEPTYKDSTIGDRTEGDDPVIRKAAVEALGPYNGSVVVVDPNTGRVLTMVNQQLALGGGFQPCSTIKVSVALAALREGLVQRTSPVRFYSKRSMDLTDALAYSNNYYFGNLGVKLGYERVNYYAHLFGYGEKAGLNIEGEHPGYFPPAPPKNGGMMMLTSFGEEISQTPLELAAIIASVANGGTLYWMQYPQTPEEIKNFQPQVKRHLDIANLISDVKPGMRGAVDFGTARRAKQEDEILGKTGTCSEGRTHLGWFGSFNEGSGRKLVVVVMLTGGRPSIGATASGVAGDVYRRLSSENFFKSTAPLTPASLLPNQICCSR
ncbi:MAG TPA: penicillin-binding transpeptidase domain-containing protein [Bryobacteraceae bacterium]|nr:penicillin-binding transpeptidase domain-containing protein [Bryobacteraceae bacterium]